MKRCCHCKEKKVLDDFYRSRNRPDGHASVCKDCSKELRLEWIAAHPEKQAEYSRKHYRLHGETHRATTRRWVAEHPERAKEINRMAEADRRVRKRGQFVEHVDPMVVYERDEGLCGICGGTVYGDFHLDHKIPLAKGGEHSYANTQIAHPPCNLAKGAKIMDEMMTKYQSVEHAEILPEEEQARINQGLRRLGKASAKDLTEDERKRLLSSSE